MRNPDVVLLDLGLPDLDGLEVTRRLREWSSMPIIVISAREQERDKVNALDAGADDYLTKPFSAGELMARIRVALRHAVGQGSGRQGPVFTVQNLRVDQAQRLVFLDNREVHLTPIEYKLLTVLIRHAGRVITHSQLLKEVWGPASVNEVQYLRVYMTQLRHKLEADPARPQLLLNEPGVGYRLRSDID
jgi:two-component system, OmpR family, KDP operon response regulator KdpE